MTNAFTAITLEILLIFSYVGISLEPIRQYNETIRTELIKGE